MYGDGDLIVPCLVDGLETFPDLVRSVKSSDVYHLILGYVVRYYDLGIHVFDVPGGSDTADIQLSSRLVMSSYADVIGNRRNLVTLSHL